ncbi:FAD-binding oxidoreductase [Mesorhizobium sp. M1C.F.Ca.ET.193.01.1.1]|uniref:NAD(P)/FAD-dependent oxidoreductase n=1 Tax=unclassified Mesorhizobium TaxID=325217 RepID=UPI000FD58FD9|nr:MULTISPECIES: FAD-dependent oxidoreductase [unclassified Mesorhizobium]TGS98984.1 FAD-binding oxidoreductase [bacterium M00.F.Ca.ET.177.01.1.1]TGQ53024.1 FAD-binding oxidoreductase [Mesorhizobium sp. M1C.F.Ca.ET.210.01.1.1]TGQ70303.1 FAD-binding oxidoreductase [Mesorhizobium sp. M1C.F.Ca.ET.212.01.1.1]TGR06632.1 FAD-binding oxidoreductase [Mesorhizobium sp. M1C.F.Ca.ET.204.01.1.1]TGR27155.1 FAD-binding oxidoreductase [Mesorhizobium sp. M1C.F.Ca.ET.196.01.1.1]
MPTSDSIEIAVVGAGVVGLATALRLAAEGLEVMLIDPNEPGSGASFGNAGTLAEYACMPVGTPAVLRALPKLLFDPDSPFSLRWTALFQLAPWLTRFVRQSLPAATRANAAALAGLLTEALPAWEEMACEAKVTDLLRRNGCLYLYRREADLTGSASSRDVRASFGVHQQVLTPKEVAALEPNLPAVAGGGLYFPESLNVTDPSQVMRRLFDAASARGVVLCQAKVTGLEANRGGVRLSGPGFAAIARKAVIAAGAFSRPLAALAGDRIPLETERGYHLEFPTETPLLTRPVCPVDLGFYMTPMAGRLRVAGTVELGGLAAPPNPRRLALLDRGVRQFFPNPGKPSSQWLGFRSSLPDSRPVIGPSAKSPDVIHAFGHGHLGLTLAAVTARWVAGFIAGRGNPLAADFAAARFS